MCSFHIHHGTTAALNKLFIHLQNLLNGTINLLYELVQVEDTILNIVNLSSIGSALDLAELSDSRQYASHTKLRYSQVAAIER